jgi:hypothetical protein
MSMTADAAVASAMTCRVAGVRRTPDAAVRDAAGASACDDMIDGSLSDVIRRR